MRQQILYKRTGFKEIRTYFCSGNPLFLLFLPLFQTCYSDIRCGYFLRDKGIKSEKIHNAGIVVHDKAHVVPTICPLEKFAGLYSINEWSFRE